MIKVVFYALGVIFLMATVNLSYKEYFMGTFSDIGIIKKSNLVKKSMDRNLLLLSICFTYLFISTNVGGHIFMGFEFGKPKEDLGFLVWIVILMTIIVVTNIYFKNISLNKEHITKYALKQTDTPKALVDFMVEAFLLKNRNEYFLIKYKYDEKATNDEAVHLNGVGETFDNEFYNSMSKTNFPVYTNLLFLINTLSKNNSLQNPIVRDYLMDNITFLTNIMGILNDENLVKSLSNTNGFSELLNLTREFEDLNYGLIKIIGLDTQESTNLAESIDY